MEPMQLCYIFVVQPQRIKVPCLKKKKKPEKKGRSLKPDTVKKFKFTNDSRGVHCGFKY